MKLIISLFAITLCISAAYSQSVTEVSAKQFGNNIEVTYLVNGMSENEPYAIQVRYTAKNTGDTKLISHVYGDVGQNVSGNGNKKVIWDVLRETDSFEGDYAFNVELTPSKGASVVKSSATPKTSTKEGTIGKFTADIKNVRVGDNNVIVKFTLLNTADNENFKVHITRSKITGPDDTAYLAKSGNQGSKVQYGFMNVVLNKGVKKEVSLLFDYVPEDIAFLKNLKIIRYIGILSSESIVFSNVNINK